MKVCRIFARYRNHYFVRCYVIKDDLPYTHFIVNNKGYILYKATSWKLARGIQEHLIKGKKGCIIKTHYRIEEYEKKNNIQAS